MHTDNGRDDEDTPPSMRPAARAPWRQPALKCLGAANAETGVNSTTDATATFS